MNKFLPVVFVVLLAGSGFAQKPQRTQAKPPSSAKKTTSSPKAAPKRALADPALEKAKLDEALALASAADKVAALKKFIRDFPQSEYGVRAAESLVMARAVLGDEKLQANENSEGVAVFKLAVDEAPTPISDRLFSEIVSKFPANLFYRDQRAAALEIAAAIEKKSAGNAKQLLSLAAFYLGIESGADAKRLADAAIAADPNSVTAYQTLGLANRLDFDLEASAKAYSKALELDPASISSKRSLAEMRRALGKPDEAAALYREIVAVYENDAAARTGLILALFGLGKKTEAESEMAKSLEQNPKNLNLLAGAAYWYAANDSGEKAVELAQKAVELEPRYIWGHIALARGLMSEKKPVEAERVLVMARQYGNFPTLEYEIASARIMAGFYREAAEELQKSFTMKDGLIQTNLGGRVSREEKNFADLIAYERRASIFEPLAADNAENAAKLKLLFEINNKLSAEAPDETEVSALTDEFVKGDDKMKLHRQMYSATLLLQKNIALPKVLELVKAAVGNADAGLDVSTPAAAVLASELYESRTVAFARNEIILIPEVPRQTLSAILRGRIEELAGWTLYQQKSYPEAIVRLRRAISVLPDKSAWWRSSMWRLGAALEADGKDKEALESYIQSYKTDRPSVLKYAVVETLYKKVHGGTEGLEAKIGQNPLQVVASAENVKQSETSKPPETIAKLEQRPATVAKASVRETPVKSVVIIVSKPDEPSTAVRPDEIITKAAEVPAQPVESDPPKVEKTVIADKQEDAKAQIPDPSAKTSDIIEPKTEIAATTEKQSDTKVQSSESLPKPVETTQTKVDETTDVKPTEIKIELVPDKTLVDSQPKADNVKTSLENPEVNTGIVATQKTETPLPAPPVFEPVKKTEADPPAETVTTKQANDKTVENTEVALPPKTTEVPAKTDASPDEPMNLLRDPLSDVVSEPKTEYQAEKPAAPPSVAKTNTTPVKKTSVFVNDPLGNGKQAANTRDLFEPVIINVLNSPAQKAAKKETEKPSDPAADNQKTEKAEDAVSSGASRVRVVDGKEITTDAKCSFEFSDDNISIINGGGSIGILVSILGEGDFKGVVATSSSPKDVEVKAQPEIAGIPGRRFYIIKSVSSSTGVYQVIFESGCEKKELVVKVR